MAGEFRIEIGKRYWVTTGLKKEFLARALDADGKWFEVEDGKRIPGSRILILGSTPTHEVKIPAKRMLR